MDRLDELPDALLADPRRLIPQCADCRHRLQEGVCGHDLHPAEEWSRPDGCPEYSRLELETAGDPSGDEYLVE